MPDYRTDDWVKIPENETVTPDEILKILAMVKLGDRIRQIAKDAEPKVWKCKQ
jgi:hypothetical protein